MGPLRHRSLGGFILPIMFGTLMDLTANRSSAFPRICGVVRVSTIWRYWTEVWATELMGSRARAFRLRGWPSPFNQGKS